MTAQLLYDADCGFCTRVARLIPRLRLRVTVSAMQSVDLAALGVSPERASVEIPLVRADGSVAYGHEAIAAALATGILPLRVIARLMTLPVLRSLSTRAYAWVSRHRHRLPGGTSTCAVSTTQNQ